MKHITLLLIALCVTGCARREHEQLDMGRAIVTEIISKDIANRALNSEVNL